MVEKKTERWPAGPIELERQENELIIEIEAERLKDFHNHPFRIKEDIEMKELMDTRSLLECLPGVKNNYKQREDSFRD